MASALCMACTTSQTKPSQHTAERTGTIFLLEEEVANYDPSTGVGCTDTPNPEADNIHILCRSRRSVDAAWDAVTARSKGLCAPQKWGMFFNIPPVLPKEGDIYVVQQEIRCATQ